MKDLKVVNLNYFSINFPDDSENEILRENYISTIEKILDTDVNIIVLNGEEGIGKTMFLKQFSQKNNERVVSSFLNPFKEIYATSDLLINDFYYQLHWLIYGKQLIGNPQVNLEDYRDIFFTLKRDRKTKKSSLIFVIDGLEHFADDKNLINILNLLPLGESGFKFLITGKEDTIKKYASKFPEAVVTNFHLTGFGIEETKKYFESFNPVLKDDEIKQIWVAANKGVPGRLQAIKRGLKEKNGVVSKFLDEFEQLNDIHELDWQHLNDIADGLAEDIVKFTSTDDNIYTIEKLAKVLGQSIDLIKITLDRIPFISTNSKQELVFNSIGSKKFFAKKFASYKQEVVKKNIDFYLNQEESSDSLLQLPKYYSQEKDYDSLIQLLGEDYFSKVIKSSQSMSVVQNLVSTGYDAAKKRENDLKLFSFALHGSLIENIEGIHIWQSELEARIELGDYDNAISLANGALLKEDRLRLLAKIARVKRKKGDILEEALIDQIRHLYSAVDLVNLGDKAVDIASDLFYSMPNLAMEIIKKSSERDDTNVNDWVLTKLTMSALEAKDKAQDHIDPQSITSMITDPKIKEISNSLSFLYGKYSAEEILREAKKFTEARDRIMFLRMWFSENLDNVDLKHVLTFMIVQLVESSSKEFSKVSLLRDVSEPLAKISDHDAVEEMISKLVTFKSEAKKLGSSLEYYQFILNLFQAKLNYNYNEAFGFFFELHTQLNEMTDIVTKLECLSLLSKCINTLKTPLNKSHVYLKETLRSSVKNLAIEICEKTAYHFHNLKDAVLTISSYDPEFGIELALRANTIFRRDRLLLQCWTGYISTRNPLIKNDVLQSIYNKIDSKFLKTEALRLFLQTHSEDTSKLAHVIIDFIKKEVKIIPSLYTRSYCLVQLIKLVSRLDSTSPLITDCKNELDNTWKKVDIDISKIEIGFLIASDLAKIEKDYATKYLTAADDIKKEIWVDSVNTVGIYAVYIKFLIRIYCGLIKTKQHSDEQFDKIKELINTIPSTLIKINVWSYFGSFCHYKNEHNVREKIISSELRPLLEKLTDESLLTDVYANICPLLYLSSSLSTIEKVSSLPGAKKEKALNNIIDTILMGTFDSEPFEESENTHKPGFDQLLDTTKLINLLEEDSNIYFCIEELIKICADTRVYSNIQRENIRTEVIKIINSKLPNKKFIKHPGFKIIAEAQLIRFEKDQKNQEKLFKAAVDEVEKTVDNLSDKIFIYIIFSELIAATRIRTFDQSKLINTALTIIEKVNSDIEFIHRVDDLSKTIHRINPSLWKQKLKDAFGKTIQNFYRNDSLNMQKRLLDNAHKHDPQFAKSLMATLDTDESRVEYRKKQFLKDHYESLEIKKKISDDKIAEKKLDGKQVADACYKSLASLNSGLIMTKKTNQLRPLLDYAVKIPIINAQYIYSYYIQNFLKRQEDSQDIFTQANSIFNTIYSLCKVVEVLASKAKSSNLELNKVDYSSASGLVVKPGDRDKAVKYIKDWIAKNESSPYIKIADPYFTKDELNIVKTILEISKDMEVKILTSGEKLGNMKDTVATDYSRHWKSICQQEAPSTRITVCTEVHMNDGSTHYKSPVHDRWILMEKAGLRIGTSLNSLGGSKDSEISEMDLKEKIRLEVEVFENYFECKVKEKDGIKVVNVTFNLF